ncbi:MAG: alpha-L-fucosidase [Tannerellaceae bacterium]|jgi:alpha-L-fucosidase|nr:alpha-L-fucosidase [Tannerellaceae bacterium]
MRHIGIFLLFFSCCMSLGAKDLRRLQQDFVDLKFGMFIHFNIPTFTNHDWPDPDADPALFNPRKLDCSQWAKAAVSAGMRYGCLTAKHHSGFCIWNTKTTAYGVMSSPCRVDVVREYVEAFRREGLPTMLYFSILDTHHKLRPGYITREHIALVKAQLTELLTDYGAIDALVIDGWDAPWSRISYEEIPFEEIYHLVKRLQPNCLLMDLNAAKYPAEALMYTDIKSYEQGAGQHLSKENNQLPALSCLPLNRNWFWKESFPVTPVKDPVTLVREHLEPLNKAYCNFILNVAPNRDGLIDGNALEALREIGRLRRDNRQPSPLLPLYAAPIVSENIAKHQPTNSTWSNDMMIMDFGNDDDFGTSWESNPEVSVPWLEVDFPQERSFNAITVYDTRRCIRKYRLLYERNGLWETLAEGMGEEKMKVHRFERVWGGRVRIVIDESTAPPAIAEFGIYDERR